MTIYSVNASNHESRWSFFDAIIRHSRREISLERRFRRSKGRLDFSLHRFSRFRHCFYFLLPGLQNGTNVYMYNDSIIDYVICSFAATLTGYSTNRKATPRRSEDSNASVIILYKKIRGYSCE